MSVVPPAGYYIILGSLVVSALFFRERIVLTIIIGAILGSILFLPYPLSMLDNYFNIDFSFLYPVFMIFGYNFLYTTSIIFFIINFAYILFDKNRYRQIAIGCELAAILFLFLYLGFSIGFTSLVVQNHYTACQSNLKNLGTALEMYSSDHNGLYPPSLQELTPGYLQSIPRCFPGNHNTKAVALYKKLREVNLGEYRYEYSSEINRYTIYCYKGNHSQLGMTDDYPRYSSINGLTAR